MKREALLLRYTKYISRTMIARKQQSTLSQKTGGKDNLFFA